MVNLSLDKPLYSLIIFKMLVDGLLYEVFEVTHSVDGILFDLKWPCAGTKNFY